MCIVKHFNETDYTLPIMAFSSFEKAKEFKNIFVAGGWKDYLIDFADSTRDVFIKEIWFNNKA